MKTGIYKNEIHPVYDSLEEFEEAHPNTPVVENWLEAREGDWVWTEDEKILQILKRNEMKDRDPYVRTVVGTFVQTEYMTFDGDFEKHPDPWRFAGRNTQSVSYFADKDLTSKEREVAIEWSHGYTLREAFDRVFPHVQNEQVIQRRLSGYTQNKEFVTMASEEFAKRAEEAGLDYEWVANQIKTYVEAGDKNGKEMLETFMEVVGIKRTKETQTTRTVGYLEMAGSFNQKDLEAAQRDEIPENFRVEDDEDVVETESE